MRIYDFILTLLASFILVALMMNASIYSYMEQKYHIEIFDTDEPILKFLGKPKDWLDDMRNAILPSVEDLAILQSLQEAKSKSNQNEESEKSLWQMLMGEENIKPKEELRYPLIDKNENLVLKQDSTFIFIGDSMMQGVGMTLASELKKRGFSVINIAKQSTGLTYTHFFDWGQALKEAFAKNPHINVVVMMVGANDPYAMPKIKYASQEWVEIYSARIKEIIDISLENGAVVVWYSAPFMRKEPLNSRLIFLNSLYKAQIHSAKQLLLDANSALAPDGIYTSYIKNENGKSVRVRGEDGIHFSGEGSRALSRLLLDRLEIIKEAQDDEAENENIAQNPKMQNKAQNARKNSQQRQNLTPSTAQNPAQNTNQNIEQNLGQNILQEPPKSQAPLKPTLQNTPQNQSLPQHQNMLDSSEILSPQEQTSTQSQDGLESIENTLQRVKKRERDKATKEENKPKRQKALDKEVQNTLESNTQSKGESSTESLSEETPKDSTNKAQKTEDKKQDKKPKKEDKKEQRKWKNLFEEPPTQESNEPIKDSNNPDKSTKKSTAKPQKQSMQNLESKKDTKKGA